MRGLMIFAPQQVTWSNQKHEIGRAYGSWGERGEVFTGYMYIICTCTYQ